MADSPLNDLTVAELRELADAKGVDVAKSANKADLVAALEAAETPDEPSAAPTGDAEPAVGTVESDAPDEGVIGVSDPETGEPIEEVSADPVEVLTVVVGDASAVLIVNDQQFALSPDDVDQARRLFDQAYYELH